MAMLSAILNKLDFYNLPATPFSGESKRAGSYTWKTVWSGMFTEDKNLKNRF